MGIIIVNPNPVFDRTITIPEMIPGAVIRTLDIELTAGGKGVNVARVLRAMGDAAPMIIPVGTDDGERYRQLLAAEDADVTVVDVPGSVRTANIYLEQRVDRVTVVNDAGHDMTLDTWAAVVEVVRERVAPGDIVLCMGSFPPGLPTRALGQLINVIHRGGARILIDTAPVFLADALAHRPDVITPNLDEALATISKDEARVMDAHGLSPDEIHGLACATALELCALGAARALVTAGAEGVAMAHGNEVSWVPAFPVRVASSVGAGDSLVAGLARVWHEQGDHVDWHRAVAMGVASAAASCEQVRAGGADPQRVLQIFAAVMALDEQSASG